ncbi:DUF3325 family protein [Paucibacter sp. XJ19-41]|uniref:DUF3325 family protein n=1 Tax=Paucibacter sp. XJ19-41 TaxID=2927824 RepID=UPI00234A4066|nr:DUF3325 family protein [Paucibacter sp. XJ19-41]MDC6166623.1 DUF3325 family protein [Paucibacter sp. XJ19-41]
MFERYHRELLNFFARAMGDRERAADVVQEAYARVLATPAVQVRDPRALLYRTAKNIVIDEYRREQVREHGADGPALDVEEALAPAQGQPDARLAARQQAERLLAAIDALPPRCKQAFVLYKLDDVPQAEIAERIGIWVLPVSPWRCRATGARSAGGPSMWSPGWQLLSRLGFGGLLFAYGCCLVRDGASFGTVLWIVLIALTATVVALTLAFKPSWLVSMLRAGTAIEACRK